MRDYYKIFRLLVLFLLIAKSSGSSSHYKVVILKADSFTDEYSSMASSFVNSTRYNTYIINLDKFAKKLDEAKIKIKEKRPDLLYCIGDKALMFALQEFRFTKIIFSATIKWDKLDFPKKFVGVSDELLAEAQLTLFRYIFPYLKRIGIIYNHKNREWFREAREQAASQGLLLIGIEHNQGEIIALETAIKELALNVDSLWLPDTIENTKEYINFIFSHFDKKKKPIFTNRRDLINKGATLTISPDSNTIGTQSAYLAADILEDSNGWDKVYSPAGSYISLNLSKANNYMLAVNRDALGNINRIVEYD